MPQFLVARQFPLLATTDDFKTVILIVGLAVLAFGLMQFFYHRKNLDANFDVGLAPAEIKFERRKHVRRMAIGRLIVCLGLVMASCYWVHERMAFAILLGTMLLLIICITILAYVDLASVGLKLSLDRMAQHKRKNDRVIQEAIANHHRNQTSGSPALADESSIERDHDPSGD